MNVPRRERIIPKIQVRRDEESDSDKKFVCHSNLWWSATWWLLYNAEFIYEFEQFIYEMEDEPSGLPICPSGTGKRQVC